MSNGNVIQGLQIINFQAIGIFIFQASNNKIGGDRNNGAGPVGQGNLVSQNGIGIDLMYHGIHNIITGNLIGTDLSGAGNWGNQTEGIWIEKGIGHTTIGPDNVIAFNGWNGIRIITSKLAGNTILRNSIHSNEGMGISYVGSKELVDTAPIIHDFDLSEGRIAGITCGGCMVEIYSDEEDEGEVYEGQTVADSTGNFQLDKGSPFIGPYLTSVTLDLEDNTSEFSQPASSFKIQDGNGSRIFPLMAKQSEELSENSKIGSEFNLCTTNRGEPYLYTNSLNMLGHKWARFSLSVADWDQFLERRCYPPTKLGSFEDSVVDTLNAYGIILMLDLVYFDPEIQVFPDTFRIWPGYTRFRDEQEIQRFLEFVRMVVVHFKGRIQYYDTWSEPEVTNFGQKNILLSDYIAVIHRLIPVIHDIDPQAKIIVGCGAGLINPKSQSYLEGIVKSDLMPVVDGISIHPMYGISPDYEKFLNFYYGYDDYIGKIKKIAITNGFRGEIFTEEMTWRTPFNTTKWEPEHFSMIVAAKYYARGIVINRGLGLWAGVAGEKYDIYAQIVRVVRSLNTVMAGAEPVELPYQVETEAKPIRAYAFELSNGERLFAIWKDGVGVDEDPGVLSTLVFPGFIAEKVTAIDVLNSAQQELIFSVESGNLVIQNLFIKDYPIFLKLAEH